MCCLGICVMKRFALEYVLQVFSITQCLGRDYGNTDQAEVGRDADITMDRSMGLGADSTLDGVGIKDNR